MAGEAISADGSRDESWTVDNASSAAWLEGQSEEGPAPPPLSTVMPAVLCEALSWQKPHGWVGLSVKTVVSVPWSWRECQHETGDGIYPTELAADLDHLQQTFTAASHFFRAVLWTLNPGQSSGWQLAAGPARRPFDWFPPAWTARPIHGFVIAQPLRFSTQHNSGLLTSGIGRQTDAACCPTTSALSLSLALSRKRIFQG